MKKQATKPVSGGNQIYAMKDSQNNSNKKLLIILLILLLVIGLIAVVIYSLLHKKDETQPNTATPKRNSVISIDNKDEILADLNNRVADGLFEATMNVDWSFENSSVPSENAYVANAITNSNTIYFDVTLDSTNETIYKSPYIPVGFALENITLETNLAAGTYPCTVLYHLVDDDYNEISSVAVAVTIRVLN